MRYWQLTDAEGRAQFIATNGRKRPSDEGCDEAAFSVVETKRPPKPDERWGDGKFEKAPELAQRMARRQRRAAREPLPMAEELEELRERVDALEAAIAAIVKPGRPD